MTIASSDRTLADLVTERAATARVFEQLGIDYCCHGDRTLEEACRSAGLDPDAVARMLDAAAATEEEDDGWSQLPIPELADHILATHHAYLHVELPALDALAAKVLEVHGERHPELARVRELVSAVRADLEPHLAKEERVLFPAIHAIYAGQREFPFGTVANPIRMMRIEHDRAGELLAALRQATNGYEVPADACASYRALYERLATLEHDTHVHVLKENYRLFPAAIEQERADMSGTEGP